MEWYLRFSYFVGLVSSPYILTALSLRFAKLLALQIQPFEHYTYFYISLFLVFSDFLEFSYIFIFIHICILVICAYEYLFWEVKHEDREIPFLL
jgi:hypothetical protein